MTLKYVCYKKYLLNHLVRNFITDAQYFHKQLYYGLFMNSGSELWPVGSEELQFGVIEETNHNKVMQKKDNLNS